MKYAGLHADWCGCGKEGDNYARHGQVEEAKCYFRCNGNYEQYCGGSTWPDIFTLVLYASVFELTSKDVVYFLRLLKANWGTDPNGTLSEKKRNIINKTNKKGHFVSIYMNYCE